MKLNKTYLRGVTVFRLDEERLDTLNGPNFKKEFLVSINSGENFFLVDFANVKYVDSSGLGALLFGLRLATENGGGLALLNIGPRVERLIQIAHLERHLTCFNTEDEALAALQGEAGKEIA